MNEYDEQFYKNWEQEHRVREKERLHNRYWLNDPDDLDQKLLEARELRIQSELEHLREQQNPNWMHDAATRLWGKQVADQLQSKRYIP